MKNIKNSSNNLNKINSNNIYSNSNNINNNNLNSNNNLNNYIKYNTNNTDEIKTKNKYNRSNQRQLTKTEFSVINKMYDPDINRVRYSLSKQSFNLNMIKVVSDRSPIILFGNQNQTQNSSVNIDKDNNYKDNYYCDVEEEKEGNGEVHNKDKVELHTIDHIVDKDNKELNNINMNLLKKNNCMEGETQTLSMSRINSPLQLVIQPRNKMSQPLQSNFILDNEILRGVSSHCREIRDIDIEKDKKLQNVNNFNINNNFNANLQEYTSPNVITTPITTNDAYRCINTYNETNWKNNIYFGMNTGINTESFKNIKTTNDIIDTELKNLLKNSHSTKYTKKSIVNVKRLKLGFDENFVNKDVKSINGKNNNDYFSSNKFIKLTADIKAKNFKSLRSSTSHRNLNKLRNNSIENLNKKVF